MLELPQLPHDNVYKFVAFAGLAILIAVNYFYFTFEERVHTEFLWNSVERVKWENLEEENRKAMVDWLVVDDTQALSEVQKAEHELKRKELLKRLSELKASDYELKAKEISTSMGYQKLSILWWVYWIGTLVGVCLMVTGIRLWYSRIQRPFDQKLLNGETQ
jgi:hypothetical protein